MKNTEHPESVSMDVPAADGTLLRVTLHPDEEHDDAFTSRSMLEIQRHTEHGLRPVVTYRSGSLGTEDHPHSVRLHPHDRGLVLSRAWCIVIRDWMSMMHDASQDNWKKEPWA